MATLLLCTGVSGATKALPLGEESYALGDADGDGHVGAKDAALILRCLVELAELDEAGMAAADTNGNGLVDAADAGCILRYLVELDSLPPSAALVTARPTPTPSPSPSPTPSPTPSPSPSPAHSRTLEDKTVFLDAGHGINPYTGTCYGHYTEGDYCESETTLSLALMTRDLLEAYGATVIMTRSNPDMVGNYQRMALVNRYAMIYLRDIVSDRSTQADCDRLIAGMDKILAEYNPYTNDSGDTARQWFNNPYDSTMQRRVYADTGLMYNLERSPFFDDMIFISIHTNATDRNENGNYDSGANGITAYCMDNAYNSTYYSNYRAEENRRLAELLIDELFYSTTLSIRSRNAKVNDFFMLREQNLTAALVEVGFHTNPVDRAYLLSQEGKTAIARGIANAVLRYFEQAPE